MRLFVFFVTVLAIARGRFVSISNDSVLEISDDRDVDCADGVCPEKVSEHRQLVRREAAKQMHSRRVRNNFVQLRIVCDCESQYNLIDLGEDHYPRHITVAKCKAKSCANQLYQCKNLLYRSNVLVKRGVNSTLKNPDEYDMRDVEEVRLPDSLQDDWELLSVPIPVTCIAVEKKT